MNNAWKDLSKRHIKPSRLLRIATKQTSMSLSEHDHFEVCEKCRQLFVEYLREEVYIHEVKAKS